MSSRSLMQGALSVLPSIATREDRLLAFRAWFAELSAMLSDPRYVAPLAGVDVASFAAGVELAIADGCFDGLDWITPELAVPAIFEIASAIPHGAARRHLGRIVLASLRTGRGSTFAAGATRLALSASVRGLDTPWHRARIELVLAAPEWAVPPTDALALAIVSRRELAEVWLGRGSSGSLGARRTAARLLERAASEVLRRVVGGDLGAVRVFASPWVRGPFERLHADREPLVWRHVAVARGRLASVAHEELDRIRSELGPSFGITEWRRASAALAASAVLRGSEALGECRSLFESEVARRDPGIVGAVFHGLTGVVDIHGGACAELLSVGVGLGGLEAVEALVHLARRCGDVAPLRTPLRAAEYALAPLAESLDVRDAGASTLAAHLLDQVRALARGERPNDLLGAADAAILRYACEGPDAAAPCATDVMARAEGLMRALDALDPSDAAGRAESFRILRDVDVTFVESDAIASLVALGESDAPATAPGFRVSDLRSALLAWSSRRIDEMAHATSAGRVELERLRTLLHLVDSDPSGSDDLERRKDLLVRLFERIGDGAPITHRVLRAAIARTVDGLFRHGTFDTVDVLVLCGGAGCSAQDFEQLSEASMVPELERALRGMAEATSQSAGEREPGMYARALRNVADALSVAESTRVDALRITLVRLADGVEAMLDIRSMDELNEGPVLEPLPWLDECLRTLSHLALGASRRTGGVGRDATNVLGWLEGIEGLHPLPSVATRRAAFAAVGTVELRDTGILRLAQRAAEESIRWLAELPEGRSSAPRALRTPVDARPAPLPAFVPVHRVLGAYSVVRSLGSGGAGTVFEARRIEDRDRPDAPTYALKVPDYDASSARTLSEAEFLAMFREEAGALLAIPPDPHIARLITFDAEARPKPMLVMELVRGVTLESLIERGRLTVERALSTLDGVAIGLEVMHRVGVAHLDVKPSNVIVREASAGSPETPVLVDFGLAGRRIRPGCGTPNCAAPEVLSATRAADASPAAVDAYAYACLAYEVLTGAPLFDADDLHVLVSMHFAHDGWPPGIAALAEDPVCEPLAGVLAGGLRAHPGRRSSVSELRRGLQACGVALRGRSWPIGRAGR